MTDWRHRSACRDEDPELFFPITEKRGRDGRDNADVQEAKAICRRCPVTGDCLTWALTSGQDSGIWGATTSDERREMRRGRPGRERVPA